MADKRVKMALIAGAAHALKYKREHPNSSDDDALQDVSRHADGITTKLDI